LLWRAWAGRGHPSSGGNRRTALKIEVFYIDGCPNHQPTVDRVNEVLDDLGLTADVVNIRVIDSKSAVATRFLGSPTVRVNGKM
jgi:hypothetical protein